MKKLLVLMLLISNLCLGANYSVKSPNGKVEVKVEVGETTSYTASYNGVQFLNPSVISMTFGNGITIGENMKVKKVERKSKQEVLKPVVCQKSATVRNDYNEMILHAKGKYAIHFRLYNDGIAYRFVTKFGKKEIIVVDDNATFSFAGNYATMFPEEGGVETPQQCFYKELKLSKIRKGKFCSTPMMVIPNQNLKIVITESDLDSYPGMFLKKQGEHDLKGKFAHYPLEVKDLGRMALPSKRAYYLAKTKGTRSYPWRAMVIAEEDKDLITNQLTYKLAPGTKADYSWVKPGKIAWDWYNALSLYGVDFEAGMNTETYKYYIDFASKYGIEYILIDDGWCEPLDITKVVPEMDIKEIVAYGKSKNVDVLVWASWIVLDRQLDKAFDLFKAWGVKGIKIDFMNRDDQKMVDFYYKIARKATKYKLLVDFHGSYKPTGWSRTFPNVMTSEGVAGLENHKWGTKITPKHNLNLPFTRMVAGPLDYTPGGMINHHFADFKPIFNSPGTIGTRCHQLGMYVIYESPLQMLADNPCNYLREEECMEFLAQVPAVWDETKVLEAKIGEYLIIARRKGSVWYIGGMTNKATEFSINLDFIKGEKTLTTWEDGINVKRQAQDYARKQKRVQEGESLVIKMYTGGGYAAIIK